jgi:Rrf2 family protein
MSISSRFAVAVHILTLLEVGEGDPVTSGRIAGSVNTNPAVVRRILSMLARAGLTRSRRGAGGGALLARPASAITLREVYCAVEGGELFAMHHEPPNDRCPVGRHIQSALEAATGAAREALEGSLGERTVADVLDSIAAGYERERGGSGPGG